MEFVQVHLNFKTHTMKTKIIYYLLPVFGFIIITAVEAKAQKVFACQYKSEAGVKVFVTTNKSEADLIVYKVTSKSEAVANKGLWFFVSTKSEAEEKIFFTQYKSEAEVVIYFSEYKSDAGWKNNSKKPLFD